MNTGFRQHSAARFAWGARIANPWFAEAFGEHRHALLPCGYRTRAGIAAQCSRETPGRDGMASRAPQSLRSTSAPHLKEPTSTWPT